MGAVSFAHHVRAWASTYNFLRPLGHRSKSGRGSGGSRQKIERKWICVFRTLERGATAWGAEHWQEPECVRRSTKPPRAPRVAIIVLSRNRFEQRSVFLHIFLFIRYYRLTLNQGLGMLVRYLWILTA